MLMEMLAAPNGDGDDIFSVSFRRFAKHVCMECLWAGPVN